MRLLGLDKRPVLGKQSIGNEWIHGARAGTSIKQGMGCTDCSPMGEIPIDVGNPRGAVDGVLAVFAGLAVAGVVALAVLSAQRGS